MNVKFCIKIRQKITENEGNYSTASDVGEWASSRNKLRRRAWRK